MHAYEMFEAPKLIKRLGCSVNTSLEAELILSRNALVRHINLGPFQQYRVQLGERVVNPVDESKYILKIEVGIGHVDRRDMANDEKHDAFLESVYYYLVPVGDCNESLDISLRKAFNMVHEGRAVYELEDIGYNQFSWEVYSAEPIHCGRIGEQASDVTGIEPITEKWFSGCNSVSR